MQLDMEKIITSQLKTNALKSLFWDQNFIGSSEFSFECSDYTIHSLLNDKKSVLLFIETLERNGLTDRFAAHISSLIIETLQDINQFLLFDENGRLSMKNVYLEFLDNIKQICLAEDIDEERITAVFRQHYFNIRNSLISISGTKVFEEYTGSPKIAKKVCSEYTPQFQLEIMHIDIWALSEPVLDLGCGKSGSLVKYLIEQGIDAYGADRSAGDYPFLLKKDWFEIDFKADSWGTVISHMAFSTTFATLHNMAKSRHIAVNISRYSQILKKAANLYMRPVCPL